MPFPPLGSSKCSPSSIKFQVLSPLLWCTWEAAECFCLGVRIHYCAVLWFWFLLALLTPFLDRRISYEQGECVFFLPSQQCCFIVGWGEIRCAAEQHIDFTTRLDSHQRFDEPVSIFFSMLNFQSLGIGVLIRKSHRDLAGKLVWNVYVPIGSHLQGPALEAIEP